MVAVITRVDLVDIPHDCGQSPFPVRNHDKDDTILHGDSIEILPRLPQRCVNAAFLDPPYNQGIDYGAVTNSRMVDSRLWGIADYRATNLAAYQESQVDFRSLPG